MPNGFAVQPDKLEDFRTKVKAIATDYQLIVEQLAEARLGDRSKSLLGVPEALGSSGPPVDFTEASRTMLANYDSLLGTLHSVHTAVQAQFTYMETALGETRGTYLRLDGEHAGVFQNLLGDRSTDGS